ncbi:MAG: hypothetical protein ACK4KW_03830 [Gemmobacter sp.]
MRWIWLALAGPMLWAVVFSAVYALHGTGCALGWTGVQTPVGNLHRSAMLAVWLAGLVLHAGLFRLMPAGRGRAAFVARTGAWIGLASSVFTLFPVAVTTSCG